MTRQERLIFYLCDKATAAEILSILPGRRGYILPFVKDQWLVFYLFEWQQRLKFYLARQERLRLYLLSRQQRLRFYLFDQAAAAEFLPFARVAVAEMRSTD